MQRFLNNIYAHLLKYAIFEESSSKAERGCHLLDFVTFFWGDVDKHQYTPDKAPVTDLKNNHT